MSHQDSRLELDLIMHRIDALSTSQSLLVTPLSLNHQARVRVWPLICSSSPSNSRVAELLRRSRAPAFTQSEPGLGLRCVQPVSNAR
jgi:hypothetical protein